MRDITMEQVEKIRQNIYETITSVTMTHEQKLTVMANHADSLMEVLDLPDGLDELLNVPIERKCICDLNEGHAPMRPRYIVPDYSVLMEKGCEFLKLDPPKDLMEALNTLLIFYKHVPSVTNYPVFIGNLDKLIDPFLDGVDDETAYKAIKMFMMHVDRTIVDSFCHADIGPQDSRAGLLIMRAEAELEDATPNLTMRYDPEITGDAFALAGVDCSLHSAKPSFANHKMFRSELGDDYAIASCYNGLLIGGGSYTLCRLLLNHIADRADSIEQFKTETLPYVLDIMARYMDARIKFIVEESNFFEYNFLAKEGFICKERFSAMYGLVGLAECVNTLFEKEGKEGRFGHDEEATNLGVEIMDIIDAFNRGHVNPYCQGTDGHFLLHAQVGLADDIRTSPGTRIPIGEEPSELIDHLRVLEKFHKYFPSGTGDIFPIDVTVHNNPEYVLDIIKGSFREGVRYLSFYRNDSDVIRVTGYLVKRSEMEKLDRGEAVLQNTTGLGLGASKNCKILERKVR
ncbi:MAG: YjjI family glycine radical enzyme [Lachnospiraceae bacterium]|jgi:YjjI family glycine radical enzyme|nr:YjjI family glycine radical enzyme [Lachnospiraceae bacterium]